MDREVLYTLQVLKTPTAFGWFPLDGKLNSVNSPECFPNLNITGRRFLHGVAAAIHMSQLSLLLCDNKDLKSKYFSPDIRLLADVADELVLMKGLDPLLFPPPCDFCSLNLLTRYPYRDLPDVVPSGISAVVMNFVPRDNPIKRDITLRLQSNPLRTYNLKGYEYLDGLTPNEALKTLALKKMLPDKAYRIIDTYSKLPMTLAIRTQSVNQNGSEFKIIFAEGESKYIDHVTCNLSLVNGGLTKNLIQIQLPISDFSVDGSFTSQDELENWLNNIAFSLATRAKPVQKVQTALDINQPQQNR